MWKYIILMRKTKGALFLLYGLVCICIWKSYKLFLIITTFTLPVCLLVATYENIFGSCGSTCLHPLCKLRVQVIHLNYVFEGYGDICSPFLPKSIRKFRDDVMHCFAFSGRDCRSKMWACKKNTVHLNCLNPVSTKANAVERSTSAPPTLLCWLHFMTRDDRTCRTKNFKV